MILNMGNKKINIEVILSMLFDVVCNFYRKKNDLFRDNSTNQLFCNPYKIYKIELLFYLGLSFMVIFLIKPFPIFYFFWINLIMDLSITRLKTDKNNNKIGLMS